VGVNAAIADIVNYINTKILPSHDSNYYHTTGPGRKIAIWYGGVHKTIRGNSFRISSSGGFDDELPFGMKRFYTDDLGKMTSLLSEERLIEAFGVKVAVPGFFGPEQADAFSLKSIIFKLKKDVYAGKLFTRDSNNQNGYNTLLRASKAISQLVNIAVRTMNAAYRAAVQLLNQIENEITESAPWELESFFQ